MTDRICGGDAVVSQLFGDRSISHIHLSITGQSPPFTFVRAATVPGCRALHRYHSNIIRPLFSTLRIVPLVLCLHSKWSAPVSFCVEACFDQTEGDVPICGHVGCGTMSMSGMRRHET